VAGSNYEVNIQLNVRRINRQLNNLERRIKKLNDIAMGQKGVGKAALKTERDKLALATKTFRREQQITKEKAKQNKLENNTLKVKKTPIPKHSNLPLGPSSPLNITNQGSLLPGKSTVPGKAAGGSGVLSGALISGAFPLLFGQGPVGALAGFGGGLIGGKLGGQTGGFAGGLVATALLTQLTTAFNSVSELGKAFDSLNPNIKMLTTSLGLAGSVREKEIELIAKQEGKQVALALATEKMNKAIGERGVKNLTEFAEASRLMGNQFKLAMTKMQAALAPFFKFFANATGASENERKRLAKLGGSQTDTQLLALKAERAVLKETTVRGAQANKRKSIELGALDRQIAEREEALAKEGKDKELNDLRIRQYDEITESVEKQNQFLNESLTMGSRKAEIEQKLREFDRKALEFDEKINMEEREQFANALRLQEELQRVNTLYQGIADTIQSGLVDAIDGAIMGTMSLGEVANSVFASIRRQLIDFGATSLLRAIPGIGGFFADGGVTKPNKSYIVGERGPELFTPGVTGRVTPNNELGSSTNIVVNVDASGSSVEGDEQRGKELGRVLSVAIQSELIQQKRPGGLLA
tara:strand:- start:8425 stop:10179 length:1755 start_codon:yes stop_codon:yes gene_type:complete